MKHKKRVMYMALIMLFVNLSLYANRDYHEITQGSKTITGQIVDTEGEPIIGANIIVKESGRGTITDIDGNFSVEGVHHSSILQISFIGYISQEVIVGTNEVLKIIMEDDRQMLDEVVVVGYGTMKKANLTGAISAISASDLSQMPTSNLSNTLAGRAPGVNIIGNSGLAGASSNIRIRGGFGTPLFVIDGVVRNKAAFDALESNEIDQLSFLKDAATASIYGSRAGNGVVLVTTKSGVQEGVRSKPVFNYQGTYTFMTPTLELLSDKTTATDELIYQNRVAEFLGINPPNGEKEFAYFENKNYNVNDYIWQTPWNTKHSMSVSGQGERISYYSLISYIGEEGSYKNLKNGRINMRSNVTAKITNTIKMNLNVAANQHDHKRFFWPFSGEDEQTVGDLYRCTFNWPKTFPFYLYEDGTPANEVTDYPVQTPMGSWQAWNVIDQVIGDRYLKTRKRELNVMLTFDVDLGFVTKGLATKATGVYRSNDYMRKRYMTYQKNYVWNAANASDNRFIPAPPDPNKINTFTFSQNQEFLGYHLRTLWSNQLNWYLNYDRSFGDHGVAGTVVWEYASSGGERVTAKAEEPLTNMDQFFVYSRDPERRWGDGYETIGKHMSWIGRFNYNYAKKYITEFSFRYDGNTLFPEGKKWGFFPSFSAAWILSHEEFMKNSAPWLEYLKLRGSVGTTGNDLDIDRGTDVRIAPFSYIPTYVSGSSYIFGNQSMLGIKPGATPNPYLTWATSTTYNVGLDYAFFRQRLSGSFELFYKRESDILSSRLVTLPDTYGQSLAPENYAARSWRGFEMNFSWKDKLMNNRLQYTVYGNLGYSKDRWDVIDQSALYLPGGNLADLSAVGKPLNRLVGFKTVGMVRTQEELDQLNEKGFTQFGRKPYLGCLLIEDVRGDGYELGADGKVNTNDIQLLTDNASPRINYGFGANLAWNNFTLDFHFQGVGMYERMISNLGKNVFGIRQYGGSVRPYYPIWSDDVWTPENPNAKYPRVVGSNWYESGTGALSFWIRNGSYLRLKNLNVGYNLPKKMINPLGVISAQLFLNSTNLFVLSAMTEFHDPEQDCYDSYPLMKSFTFGVNIKF